MNERNEMDVIVIESSSEEEIEKKETIEAKQRDQRRVTKPEWLLNDGTNEEDVVELYATKHIKDYARGANDRYYEDDLLTDSNEVKARWNLKTLGDRSKNLSVLNHRVRLYKEDKAYVPRQFRPGIFLDAQKEVEGILIESKSTPKPNEPSNIEVKNETFENEIRKFEAQIKEKNRKQIELLEKKQRKTQGYQKTGKNEKMSKDYGELLEKLKQNGEEELEAFKSLLKSGNFSMKNGQIERYAFMEWEQSSTWKYRSNDGYNGKRKILLPETEIKNIMIEDAIYSFYYGKRSFK
jgi:hypothetical protein